MRNFHFIINFMRCIDQRYIDFQYLIQQYFYKIDITRVSSYTYTYLSPKIEMSHYVYIVPIYF